MAESDENKAAVEYWDRVAESAKRPADAETVAHNRDRAEERETRKRTGTLSRRR
jgi:hypothetical protein